MPQFLYFGHLLSLSHIQSQNIVCQCGDDVLMPNAYRFRRSKDQPTSTGCLCSATSSPHSFVVTVLPCRSTRRLSSSRIVFPSSRSYVSHPAERATRPQGNIVEECPLTAFPGNLRRLHEAGPDEVEWLSRLSMKG